MLIPQPDLRCRREFAVLLRIRSIFGLASEEQLRLIDYLSVPYRLEAETAELADGAWVRRVSYPELPGCTAEAAVVEDALSRLERKRIEIIIHMVGDGRSPPVPRPPLRDCDPAWVAKKVGVARELVTLIDRDEATIISEQHSND
jgi:predicted RNase H-like HicB family nuclease